MDNNLLHYSNISYIIFQHSDHKSIRFFIFPHEENLQSGWTNFFFNFPRISSPWPPSGLCVFLPRVAAVLIPSLLTWKLGQLTSLRLGHLKHLNYPLKFMLIAIKDNVDSETFFQVSQICTVCSRKIVFFPNPLP